MSSIVSQLWKRLGLIRVTHSRSSAHCDQVNCNHWNRTLSVKSLNLLKLGFLLFDIISEITRQLDINWRQWIENLKLHASFVNFRFWISGLPMTFTKLWYCFFFENVVFSFFSFIYFVEFIKSFGKLTSQNQEMLRLKLLKSGFVTLKSS